MIKSIKYLSILIVATAMMHGKSVAAEKRYDEGATDTEIKIGNTMPYSGPASAYAIIGKAQEAYFRKINAEGGINGRKISFLSYDDTYSPPKTVEQVRRLVENDGVLLMFYPFGTAPNSAIQKYLNAKRVPQLFVAGGATRWGDPEHFPWTIGWQPSYQSEGKVYAKYVLATRPSGKIAVIYQNDDYGKDLLRGLKEGLAENASMIVAEEPYETTEPTIDPRIVKLKASGADILVSITTPKFSAQAMKKVHELSWNPLYILNNVSASVGSVIKPVGFEAAQGVISSAYIKDITDPTWKDDPAIKELNKFLDDYMPGVNRMDANVEYGVLTAQTLVRVLQQCGDDLTRANIMRQVASLKNVELGLLLPGITINTSETDFFPLDQLQLMRFSGEGWQLFGDPVRGSH